MKLIIDIPEDVYNVLVRDVTWANEIEKIIINGTPLNYVIGNIKANMKDMFDSEDLFEIIDKHIVDMRGKADES